MGFCVGSGPLQRFRSGAPQREDEDEGLQGDDVQGRAQMMNK